MFIAGENKKQIRRTVIDSLLLMVISSNNHLQTVARIVFPQKYVYTFSSNVYYKQYNILVLIMHLVARNVM